MKSKHSITQQQLGAILNYIGDDKFKSKKAKKELKFFLHPAKNKDVFVKYTAYSIEPDGSVFSQWEMICIKPDGEKEDCNEMFDSKKEFWGFQSDLAEVDFDANGNIVII